MTSQDVKLAIQDLFFIKMVASLLVLISFIPMEKLVKVINFDFSISLKPLEGCSVTNCKTCPSDTCSACETNYALYKGECVSCPDGTYSTGTTCQGKSYFNLSSSSVRLL